MKQLWTIQIQSRLENRTWNTERGSKTEQNFVRNWNGTNHPKTEQNVPFSDGSGQTRPFYVLKSNFLYTKWSSLDHPKTEQNVLFSDGDGIPNHSPFEQV